MRHSYPKKIYNIDKDTNFALITYIMVLLWVGKRFVDLFNTGATIRGREINNKKSFDRINSGIRNGWGESS